MNKTLMERARSMLSGAGLGQEFWAEAVDTACYFVNRSPSSALEDKTPQEVWTGKKPSLSHLRVFGCDAYVHVPKEKRTKLDSKSEKCIFIGDKDGLKGYKLWNPVTRKVVYSRDMVFREVKDVIKHEVQPKEPVKIEFERKEEESDSVAEEESEDEEPQTPANCEGNSGFRGKLWKEAMVDEMASLHKNEACDLVELPAGRKPIGSKWVFKKKTNAEGKVEKYKARLVAKVYSQVPGIDFGDIFSPVAKVTSIRLLLSVVVSFDFEVEQMDVKTIFLHGDLEEEIYMKKPEGFADSKPVKVPIPVGVRLSAEQCPKTQEEEEDMSHVPYASAAGSLMYAMVYTRPDIAHAVGVLSRFMSKPGKEHWTAVKRVFRYLRGTSDYGCATKEDRD
eukprot:PITA_24014